MFSSETIFTEYVLLSSSSSSPSTPHLTVHLDSLCTGTVIIKPFIIFPSHSHSHSTPFHSLSQYLFSLVLISFVLFSALFLPYCVLFSSSCFVICDLYWRILYIYIFVYSMGKEDLWEFSKIKLYLFSHLSQLIFFCFLPFYMNYVPVVF